MKKYEGFTNREVTLLEAWDECNRPQIDDALEAQVLEAVHEAGCSPCEHELYALLDPLPADEDENAVVMAMIEDAAEALLELQASENEDHRSSQCGGTGLCQERMHNSEDAPDVHKEETPVNCLLRVVEEVLRETTVPMSVREIVERAGARLPSRSKTPDTVVARDLSMHIKRYGEHSIFVRASPGRYTLRGLTAAPSMVAAAPSVAALPPRHLTLGDPNRPAREHLKTGRS